MNNSGKVFSKAKKWLGAGVLLAGTSLLLVACGSGQQSIGNALKLEFTGYDGSGTVSLSDFDNQVYEISLRQAGLSKSDAEAVVAGDALVISRLNSDEKQAAKLRQASLMAGTVSYELSETTGLSNGDKILLTIKTSSKESPVKEETKEYTVTGLKDFEVVKVNDLLKDSEARMIGFEGFGHLKIGNNSSTTKFHIDSKNENLSNGDTVRLAITEDYLQTLKNEGKKPEKEEFDYSVKDLKPIESISNLMALREQTDKATNNYYQGRTDTKYNYKAERQRDFVTFSTASDKEEGSGQVIQSTIYKVTKTYRRNNEQNIHYIVFSSSAYLRKDGRVDLETSSSNEGVEDTDFDYLVSLLEGDGFKELRLSSETKSDDKTDESSEKQTEESTEEESEEKVDESTDESSDEETEEKE